MSKLTEPLKQAITIYIDMHGNDIIRIPLENPSPNFTHTFVSTIGKLGCINIYKPAKNDEEYCKAINKYKSIFQGKTICESNKFLAESHVDNVFDDTEKNKGNIKRITKKYPSDLECNSVKYHQDYIPSANKTRIIWHERIYNSWHEDQADTEYEKKYMGIFVIETYNMRNPIINEIFDELKSLDTNCRLLNLCRYFIIKHIYNTLNDKKDEIPELDILSIINDMNHFDLSFYPLLDKPSFETVHAQKGSVPMPVYDETEHTFKEIYDNNLDTLNNYKIKEISLSDILQLLFILGFEHVNIIDESCRGVIEEIFDEDIKEKTCTEGDCPDFMKPHNLKNMIIRSISSNEKASARQFLRSNPNLGGNKKSKRVKKSKNKRSKNKRGKNKRSKNNRGKNNRDKNNRDKNKYVN